MNSSPHIRKLFLTDYEDHYDRVFRYIRMRVSHEEEAQDITSDVFMSAVQHLDQYDSTKGKMIQWLMGMAKNSVVDYWRKQKPLFVERSILEQESGDINKGMIDSVDLQRILKDLSHEERALVTLHYVDGYSYEEIATMMSATEAAVRQRASRILRRLRLHHTNYEK